MQISVHAGPDEDQKANRENDDRTHHQKVISEIIQKISLQRLPASTTKPPTIATAMSNYSSERKQSELEVFENSSSRTVPKGNSYYICTLSFWSNLCFFIGGILFVWIAGWKLSLPVTTLVHSNRGLDYEVVAILAPFYYVLNAGIEIVGGGKTGLSLLFGLAAVLDLAAALDGEPSTKSVLWTAADHIYLMQAVLGLLWASAKHETPMAKKLWKCGLVLFLVGSLIDVVLSYVKITMTSENHHGVRVIQSFSLLAALLWTLNAVLFILADVVDRYCYNHGAERIRDHALGDGEPSSKTVMEAVVV